MLLELQAITRAPNFSEDLRNVRFRLELLKAISAKDQGDWEELAETYTEVLLQDRESIRNRIESAPDEEWVESGRDLLERIDAYIISRADS